MLLIAIFSSSGVFCMPKKPQFCILKEEGGCTSVHLYVCLLFLPDWLPWAVSSIVLCNITNPDCVCNIPSTKSSLFNEARNAAKFPGLILITLVSGGEFPPCLIYGLGLILVKELKICFQLDFADKTIAPCCCTREAVGKAESAGGIPLTCF